VNADIFLFDEPTSPLSPYEVEKIFNLINMLKSKGKGVVFVTHRVDEALKICDRITVLRNGKKIGIVDAHKTNEEELIEMMLGTQIHEFYFVKEGKEMKEITKTETPLIELRGIYSIPTKPTEVPLRNVNLRIYENEVVAVFGIIGAGKTELGKSLIGITKMARGDIYYKGKKIKIKSPAHALSKYGIFYLTEDRRAEGIIPLLSVLTNMSISAFKNVSLGGILINAFKERELGTRFVKELNIKAPSLYVRASNLSGGNQQKVLLARALMTGAKLLIVDEPTVGIDVGAKIEIRRKIREISSKTGISVLVLTSDLDEALGIGERVYFMHNGTIVSEYTNNNPDEIRRKIISDFSNIVKK
jgi:ABC-type sugar transport system ATPase subunit